MSESGRRRDEFLDVDELGRRADYGLKRRMARIRFFLMAGVAAIVAAIVAFWLFGQFLALASLPAILILASVVVAVLLRLSKHPLARAIAFTLIAFAVGLVPHALFLIVYNLDVAFAGHKNPGYLPFLGGIFDAYEDGVLKLHAKIAVWAAGSLVVAGLAGLALLVGLVFASRAAAKLPSRQRLGVGVAEALALGAVSTALFTLVPAGHWSPNYGERLANDMMLLDQTRVHILLTEKAAAEATAEAPAIRAAYGPSIHVMAAALDTRSGPPADPSLPARQLGAAYAESAAEAGSSGGAIKAIDPGPASDMSGVFADRPAVLATEQKYRDAQRQLEAARQDLARAISSALGASGNGNEAAIVQAFAESYADDASDRLGTRFDLTFGLGVADRLARLDEAPGHPLTGAIGQFLTASLSADEARRYEPSKLAETLTRISEDN